MRFHLRSHRTTRGGRLLAQVTGEEVRVTTRIATLIQTQNNDRGLEVVGSLAKVSTVRGAFNSHRCV